jgi:molecular chaperone GrpE
MMRKQTGRQEQERRDVERDEATTPDGTEAGSPDEPGSGFDVEAREDGVEAEIELLEAELDEVREELQQVNDRHLRLAAEFDNYRKRTDRDREALGARLQLGLIAPLLEVVDDLERVGASGEDAGADAILDGIRLVEKKFHNVLRAAGVEPVEAEGAEFDPEVMEAMMTVRTADPTRDDRVADVFQRGYRLGDVLVRPARVRVLKYEGSAGGSE